MPRVRNFVPSCLALLLALAAPGALGAQRPVEIGPDGEPTQPDRFGRRSPFNLASGADFARVLVNPGHTVEFCAENYPNDFLCPYGFYPNGTNLSFRDGTPIWGVPHSTWEKARQLVPSLDNVMFGRGWTVMSNVQINSLAHQILPKDGTLGSVHRQVAAGGGGCTSLHGWTTGDILGPLNDCEVTWGSLGWIGAQEITAEMWQDYMAANPGSGFDFWRVPGAFAEGAYNADRGLGTYQTYMFMSDWSIDKAQVLGNVVPVSGVLSPPQAPGWPLGIDVRLDAFAFDLPSLRNMVFYQMLFINRSEDVYGVGLDYDSLYIGWVTGAWFHASFQSASAYIDLKNGAYKSAINGMNPNCNGKTATTDITCINVGDIYGAHAIVVLKSPIGDLRNKHFSDPSSPFYNPGHPLAGDTITFNHFHMCGFRQCNQTTFQRMNLDSDGMQRAFGMISSTPQNVLGTRTVGPGYSGGTSPANYWHTFRSETFQDPGNPVTFFNEYVVPGWNNSHGFDRVWLDPCGTKGCVAAWSDTMPNLEGDGYLNAYNNTGQVISAGPITLAAGDTTSMVLAFITSPNLSQALGAGAAEVDVMIERAVDAYMNFFLTPKPAPPPTVRAVTVNSGANPEDRSVELFLSLETLNYVDPFLISQAEAFASDPLNQELVENLRARASDNIRAIHIFKSCNNGNSYTNDADCDGDPATDPEGRFAGIGWLPYVTFEVDAGPVPVRFRDPFVVPGETYLYVVVAETRGAEFIVLSESEGVVTGELIEFAPPLFNTLTNNVDLPNVVSVRVPLALAAGARPASVAFTSQEGRGRVGDQGFEPFTVSLVGQNPVPGTYVVTFGDSARVEQPADPAAGGSSTVTLFRASGPVTFTGPADLTLAGFDDPVENGGTAVRTATSLTAVLAGPDGAALLATANLTGDAATPGEFIGSSRFPGVLVSIANRPGEFNRQFFENRLTGGELAPQGQPSVRWDAGQARRGEGAGDYVFEFSGDPFGPGRPFQIDFANPAATAQAMAQSIAARSNASTSVTPTPEQAAAIVAALTPADSSLIQRINAGRFRTASLPFRVRNAMTGAEVQVVLVERTSNIMTLGNALGSIQVEMPADAWLPGDEMILLEGGRVAFARAVLNCQAALGDARCNPAVQVPVTGTTPAVYAGPDNRHALHVQYFTGFDATTRIAFEVTAAKQGGAITADDIRAGLRNVRVVPNPYLVTSSLDTNTQNRIAFTGLPPRGRVRIYSLAGQFLQEITWSEGDLQDGDLLWDMRTFEGNLVASGLYLYVVHALDANGGTIGQARGKFVIIR